MNDNAKSSIASSIADKAISAAKAGVTTEIALRVGDAISNVGFIEDALDRFESTFGSFATGIALSTVAGYLEDRGGEFWGEVLEAVSSARTARGAKDGEPISASDVKKGIARVKEKKIAKAIQEEKEFMSAMKDVKPEKLKEYLKKVTILSPEDLKKFLLYKPHLVELPQLVEILSDTDISDWIKILQGAIVLEEKTEKPKGPIALAVGRLLTVLPEEQRARARRVRRIHILKNIARNKRA